jgi:D-xylose transport system substrate-binding protein
MSTIRARRRSRSLRAPAVLLLVVALTVAACGGDDDDNTTSGGGGGGKSVKIALLLPETKTARYETQDRPLFEAKVKKLCSSCKILYSNAEQDAAEQQSQAEAALTNGADVLVLDPVDSASAASIVTLAKQRDVPVISYDRLITDADVAYYISYDNAKVGELQATALTDKLAQDGTTSGKLVMINGAPTDNNAGLFKKGAHSVLDKSKYKIGVEYDTPEWSPDEAQSEMEQAITRLGKDGFVGVYAANDGTSGGAIAAMKAAGITPIPPITGQDAEVAGIQRVLAGEQYMTIYKAIKPQAEDAAEVALALGRGEKIPSKLQNKTTDNGKLDVPSMILDPVAVTADNVKDTVIADKFWSVADICTTDYKDACTKAGIS